MRLTRNRVVWRRVLRTMTPFMFRQSNSLVRSIMSGSGGGTQWQRRMARRPLLTFFLLHDPFLLHAFAFTPLRPPGVSHSRPWRRAFPCNLLATQAGNPRLYSLLREREGEARARLKASGHASLAPPGPAQAAAQRQRDDAKGARPKAAAGEAAVGPAHGCGSQSLEFPRLTVGAGLTGPLSSPDSSARAALCHRLEICEDEMGACRLDDDPAGRALRQGAESNTGGAAAVGMLKMGPGPLPGGRI